MDYGTLQTDFKDMLNRNDCTDSLADRFIGLGIRRTERLLRTPLQRHTIIYTIEAGGAWELPIPVNYLGIHLIYVDNKTCPRIIASQEDSMAGWYFQESKFVFSDQLPEGTEVRVVYYDEFSFPITEDDDLSEYTIALPDIIIYSAMVFACTFFVDERKTAFEGDLQAMVSEVQTMADLDEMAGTGMAVTPIGGGIA